LLHLVGRFKKGFWATKGGRGAKRKKKKKVGRCWGQKAEANNNIRRNEEKCLELQNRPSLKMGTEPQGQSGLPKDKRGKSRKKKEKI